MRLAILGPGLLGGSLALASAGFASVRVWGRRPEALTRVREMDPAVEVFSELAEAVSGADLIVAATPVGVMPGLFERVVEVCDQCPGSVLTDVGSVKRGVVEAGERITAGSGIDFVGSHPMAGSEMSGIEAARADLFSGTVCVVTPSGSTPAAALERAAGFWRAVGCRIRILDPAEHDRVVARISHLPHLAAAALVCGALDGGRDDTRFAGRGWSDSTRVASGDPALWVEILMENRDEVLESARDTAKRQAEVIGMLERRDRHALLAFLQQAKQLRDAGLGRMERGDDDGI